MLSQVFDAGGEKKKKKKAVQFFSFLASGFNLSASIIKTHSALCLTH